MDEEDVIGADDELFAPLVISSFIEDHISGARTDVENHRMKSAVVKYLGATILLIERKCCSQNTILDYLSEFLDVLEGGPGAFVSILQQSRRKPIFQASEHSDVFALYHEVLTLLRTEFQPTTQVVARICVLLADLETLYPEISHHAEVLYGVAIQAYEEMESFDHLLQCQLSLANVLIDLNRTSDAYELLARASGKYVRDHLGFWFDGKLSTKPYRLASLFPQNPGVRPSILRIKHILSKKMETTGKSRDDSDLYVKMIHEIASLGGILSVEASQSDIPLHLEALDPLWSELFRKLSSLDDVTFGMLKAFAYIQRSNYISDGVTSFCHPNSLDDIATAHRYLNKGGHLRADLKTQLIKHIEELRGRTMNLPNVQVLDIFSLAGMSRCAAFPFLPVASELRSSPAETVQDVVEDIFETVTMSRRYGVTFNDNSKKGLRFIN